MYCPQCGREYAQRVNFCCQCGAALFTPAATSPKKLVRPRADRKIAGVCAGFADYLGLDVTLVRILWLMLIFFGGWGLLAYLIAWIVMPLEPVQLPGAVTQPSASAQPATSQ